MPKKIVLICLALGLGTVFANAQSIASIEVNPPQSNRTLVLPQSLVLDGVTNLPSDSLQLFVVKRNKKEAVAFQVEEGTQRILHWLVKSDDISSGKATYSLEKGIASSTAVPVSSKAKNGALTIGYNGQDLLSYQYETVYPPAGVDSAYRRSGFIHPLYSPRGHRLTRIQPDDHYHHYGIWNPWTHVLYKGDTLDFWNLVKKQATVRFADFVRQVDGPVFSEYQALQEHVVLKDNANEVALREVQSVRIYQPTDDYYIMDITVEMNCATPEPFTILEYRYAGMGWRATEKWDKENSEMISSTGKTRKDVDGSKERWCIIQGEVDGKYAGMVWMSHPTNYSYPEPMRIWPIPEEDRGDVFVSFAPTKFRDWVLQPKKVYQQRYRFIVFNDKFTSENAETGWQDFARQSSMKITMSK